jgi:hypothetical protein
MKEVVGLNVGAPPCGPFDAPERDIMVRTRKHKVTTDSDHKFNIAPNLLDLLS